MWLFNESTKPSPTEVESYWAKPKLSNIGANQVIKAKDFGAVSSIIPNDVNSFFSDLASTSLLSSFER